jgi:hypothetical protein
LRWSNLTFVTRCRYVLSVCDGEGSQWKIKKRYSQFLALHSALCKAPGIGPKVLGTLPSRHMKKVVAKGKAEKKAKEYQQKAQKKKVEIKAKREAARKAAGGDDDPGAGAGGAEASIYITITPKTQCL